MRGGNTLSRQKGMYVFKNCFSYNGNVQLHISVYCFHPSEQKRSFVYPICPNNQTYRTNFGSFEGHFGIFNLYFRVDK